MVRELGGLPGVVKVETDQRAQVVRLTLDVESMSPDEAKKELKAIGFPTE